MDWLLSHWEEITVVVGTLFAAAGIVVKWTRTKKDDEALEKIQKKWDRFTSVFTLRKKK